jgi:putative two-component system response regulator
LAEHNERKRILVADDDPAIAELMKRVLSDRFDVVTAYNGNDAIAVAMRPPLPDLLLLDIMMPGLDGLSVAKHLKSVPALAKNGDSISP